MKKSIGCGAGWLILLAFPLAGCGPIVTATPPSAPQVITVTMPSSLRWLEPSLRLCAADAPGMALILGEQPAPSLDFSGSDVILWMGTLPAETPFAAALAEDDLAVIAGSGVFIGFADANELRQLYHSPDAAFHVWTYSAENDMRKLFERAVMGGVTTSASALLAPDPAAMLQAIAEDPHAIGYLPRAWLSDQVKTIALDPPLQQALSFPILALTAKTPQGELAAWLACLQTETR